MMNIMDVLEKEQLKQEVPAFNIGDTVKVSVKVVEGNKERIQVFAMRLGFEPLFYRLFVEKPQIKKDQHHEN